MQRSHKSPMPKIRPIESVAGKAIKHTQVKNIARLIPLQTERMAVKTLNLSLIVFELCLISIPLS